MDVSITHKRFGRLNAYRKPIVGAINIALLIGIFWQPTVVYPATLKEPVKISATVSTELGTLSKHIKQLVMELEYPDKVAEDFVAMVISWKDKQGQPVLVAWKQRINQARQDYKQSKISEAQLAKVEENIAKELSQRIQKEIRHDFSEKFFDLGDVVKNKLAQCLGYSQSVYIVGNSVGLSVQAIEVVELMTGLLPAGAGHRASIVSLTDGRAIMVDLVIGGFVSKSFKIEEEFAKVGNYWELKDKTNPLGIHRRIQILDRNGLIASIYSNRGVAYAKLGQHTQAISDYTKTIEFNPKFAETYYNRGVAYATLGKPEEAKNDLLKAVELNPALKALVQRISDHFKLVLSLD